MLFSSLRLSKRIPSKLIYNKKYSALNVFKYFKELGLDPSSKGKYSQTCLYPHAEKEKFYVRDI